MRCGFKKDIFFSALGELGCTWGVPFVIHFFHDLGRKGELSRFSSFAYFFFSFSYAKRSFRLFQMSWFVARKEGKQGNVGSQVQNLFWFSETTMILIERTGLGCEYEKVSTRHVQGLQNNPRTS